MRVRNIKTVSIGIPAFNEEANIGKLLRVILAQAENNFILKEIIVISDGSTDATTSAVREINDSRIKLIAGEERLGKSTRLNQIFQECKGDILFLMDADIIIKNNLLLSEIISQTDFSKMGIVGINTIPDKAISFFAKSLNQCKKAEEKMRSEWNKGNNYLAFHGAFIGLYGNFARTINMQSNLINNDAYIYFLAKKKGYEPKYLSNQYIYFKTPEVFKDHLMQSSRFESSQKELSKFFELSDEDYKMPIGIFIPVMLKYFIGNPVYSVNYLLIFVATKIMKMQIHTIKPQWSIAASTKRI